MPTPSSFRRLIMLLLIGLVTTGCGSGEQPPVRVGTNVWPGYEPLYLARELGKLPESEIRLVEYPSATEVIRAFRNRSLEAAGLTLDEALVLLEDRLPLKVVLVMDVSSGADVVMAKAQYASMEALRGKRIGVESSALGAYMLTRALELHGMTLGDVVVERMDVNLHREAFLGGQVDAVVTFEPVRTQLLNAGAIEVFSSAQIPGEVVDVLVVHEDVYRDRPEAFRQLTNAWFETLAYITGNRDQAAEIMAKRQKITPAELIASLEGLTLPTREENLRMLGGKDATLHATVDKLGRVLLDNNLVRRPVADPGILSAEMLR